MADFTTYKALELPKSNEKYNVSVANKNSMVIDSELHKLEMKNQSQDELLATKEALNAHIDDRNNPHRLNKNDIGLNNIDNTSDLNKPVSLLQQDAINAAMMQSKQYTDIKIAELINDAPETLDTLKEIADAIEENEIIVQALDAAIGTKVNQTDILKSIESINENTIEGKVADALVVKEVFQSVSNGKQLVASAITDKGVETEATDTFAVMAENIKSIPSNGTSETESPLIYNFNYLISFGVAESNFYFYFPVQKIKKMTIRALKCNLLLPISSSANKKKIYFEIIGYNNELGKTKTLKSFSAIITSDLKAGTELINVEDIEVDLSEYESLKYFSFYADESSTGNRNNNYPYIVELQECIFELYT